LEHGRVSQQDATSPPIMNFIAYFSLLPQIRPIKLSNVLLMASHHQVNTGQRLAHESSIEVLRKSIIGRDLVSSPHLDCEIIV
jgi:hypothetical protein